MKKYVVFALLLLLATDVGYPQGFGGMIACAKLPDAQQQECTQRMAAYMFAPLPHIKNGTLAQEQTFNAIFNGLKQESDHQSPKQWVPLMIVRADGSTSIAIYYLGPGAAFMPFP